MTTLSIPTFQLYGRRQSRALKPAVHDCWEQNLTRYGIGEDDLKTVSALQTRLGKRKLVLEIGCGNGDHLIHQAMINPDVGFVGVEPFVNGCAQMLYGIVNKGLSNVGLYHGDVRPLMGIMASHLWDIVYIHYPDPWPKTKHSKRRLIQDAFLQDCVRTLKPEGVLHITTDDVGYQTWIWEKAAHIPQLQRFCERKEAHVTAPEGWVRTRYEEKAFKHQRTPLYFSWMCQKEIPS